ncbi:MAG TPA: YlxR family protein [Acidimicrobiales bacterium]|nr:YlxR family protein [Acidimicrobiales bacterium]
MEAGRGGRGHVGRGVDPPGRGHPRRRGRGITPTRTCVGCRRALPADELVRVVLLPDGELSVDRHGPGRGAWLCRGSLACTDEAARRHAFDRALAVRVDVTATERLRRHLYEVGEQPASDVRG